MPCVCSCLLSSHEYLRECAVHKDPIWGLSVMWNPPYHGALCQMVWWMEPIKPLLPLDDVRLIHDQLPVRLVLYHFVEDIFSNVGYRIKPSVHLQKLIVVICPHRPHCSNNRS